MHRILEAVLQSSKPTQVKHEFVHKVKNAFVHKVISAGEHVDNPADVVSMLHHTSLVIIEHGQTDFEVESCKKVYVAWARCNPSALEDHFTAAFLHGILAGKFTLEINVVWLTHQSLVILKGSSRFDRLCHIVKTAAISFVRDHSEFEMVAAFCQLLFDIPACIPDGAFAVTFCTSIIHAVSTFSLPMEPERTRHYIQAVGHVVGRFLSYVWSSFERAQIMQLLRTIFSIISYIDDIGLEPSIALGGIIQYIPVDIMDMVTKTMVADQNVRDANMTMALKRMIGWLSWPGAVNIDHWVVAFLHGLASVHKHAILVDIIESQVEQLFNKLSYSAVRRATFHVFSHMLLSFQDSPEPFHKIVGRVPHLVSQLRNDKSNIEFLHRLAQLMHCLMQLHPGYPDLYEPVLEAFKDYPRPTSEVIDHRLSQSRWPARRTASSVSLYSPSLQKSETGKTGLMNLGNTCYMNSVLQALFMCDSFRRDVLTLSCGRRQTVQARLQLVFAFLTKSQRVAYAPHELLKLSRPTWFEPGNQQDCSEFLRCLFNQLHEQEITECKSNRNDRSSKSNPSLITLIERTFGGRLLHSSRCLKCGSQSTLTETFTDIPLAFPTDAGDRLAGSSAGRTPVKPSMAGGSSLIRDHDKTRTNGVDCGISGNMRLADLVSHYFKPERLEGDNKYQCDACRSLQDCERTLKVIQAPECLILTLLRFSYDVKTQSRSKIFQDMTYPKTMYLDVHEDHTKKSSHRRSRQSPGVVKVEVYALVTVIVHSGLSLDCGHYYCYARHCVPAKLAKKRGDCGDVDYLDDKWYLLNDCRVSYSSYSSFSNVTKRFAKDTAYVLFYKRIHPEALTSEGFTECPQLTLREELSKAVDRDNEAYLQELELLARKQASQSTNQPSSSWFNNWNDDNDKGPPGSCGGGGSLHPGSRLVF